MALATSTYYSSFDIGSGTNVLDYSPMMFAALKQDPALLSRIRVGEEATDTTYRWVDDALNAHQVILGASAASDDTAVTLTTNHGLRTRIGTLLKTQLRNAAAGGETMQVTATAASAVTVSRAYGGVAVSIANSSVLDIVGNPLQEASGAQNDVSTSRTQRTNATQIFERTIQISRNQLLREMVAVPSEWDQQVRQRMFEVLRELGKTVIYGVANSTTAVGSDTQYRSLDGIDKWCQASGGNSVSTAATFSQANVNSNALTVWQAGGDPDLLVVPAQLQQDVSAFDTSSVRRMETSRTRGYFVDYYLTDLGVPLEVVLSPYSVYSAGRGDYYILDSSRIALHPFRQSAWFLLSSADNSDGRTGRVIGEWTFRFSNPEGHLRATNVAA